MMQVEPSMTICRPDCGDVPAEAEVSIFSGSGASECHIMVRPLEHGSVEEQLEWIHAAYRRALVSAGLDGDTCVFRRFFLSDAANQTSALEAGPFAYGEPCATSISCQPPVPPAKAALWAYHVGDAPDKEMKGQSLLVRRGGLTHIWTTGLFGTERDTSYGQTNGILKKYEGILESEGMSLADNVIRTWFFVRDVDANYRGLVDARRGFFAKRGMTPDTHYIASTGIEGSSANTDVLVSMDAYSVSGMRSEQIRFLKAPDHLSPTHLYGVTFERGVSVSYRDRKHVMISGTASIDGDGMIVHPGDVRRQLDRTLENVEALLGNAGASFRDVCAFIVYVRDASDFDIARMEMKRRFGSVPAQIVLARVCRPGWLIEVECQAVVRAENPSLPAF